MFFGKLLAVSIYREFVLSNMLAVPFYTVNHWLLGHSFHLSGVSADSGSTLGLGVVRSKSDALLWFVPTTVVAEH